jgi:hypothetical protein
MTPRWFGRPGRSTTWLSTDDRPRMHHYLFAHRELPSIVRRFGPNLAGLAREGHLDDALRTTWTRVGEALPPKDRLAPDGLAAELRPLSHGDAILITMPPAVHVTEAHFALVVLTPDQGVRYFVLEHAWHTDDTPYTVLGEWTERAHHNLGEGPAADADLFVAEVERLLA